MMIHGSWTSCAFNVAKFDKNILLFRSASLPGAASPAQLFFNHPVRDYLPAPRRSFSPEWQKVAPHFRVTGPTIEEATNRSQKNTHPLAPFVVCNHVLIHHPDFKQLDMQGVIVEVGKHSDNFNQNPN
jgi:hypothetical protein